MKLNLHNKLSIKINNKHYVFFNTILKSIFIPLSNSLKFNEYISIGNGQPSQEIQNNYHLTNVIKIVNLTNKSIQSNIENGQLFAKYEYSFENNLNSDFITELGLSDNDSNPIIYNYFNLIDENNPNGLYIKETKELLFEITIYLSIDEIQENILTLGNNPFIEYLLGNGLGNIYIANGSNFSSNTRIDRQTPINATKYLCEKNFSIVNNNLTINFEKTLNIGKLDEILFITEEKVFARINVQEIKQPESKTCILTSKHNYIIKINEDIKNVSSITNQTTTQEETNCYVSKYANMFGDKINIPNNIFNDFTPRFLSKDGKIIFFILDDKVYSYKNTDFKLIEINTINITDNNIIKIITLDEFVFIISKTKPYISTYIINNNTIIKTQNNFNIYENYSDFANFSQFDITYCRNNKFIFGYLNSNNNAISIYFDYTNNGFVIDSYITNNREFNYAIAMVRNNFCDGRMIYLKEAEDPIDCRIVTHFSDKTESDVYTNYAYELTHNCKKIYCNSRAIIAEKTTSPSLIIYYYPQIYKYELSLLSSEISNYISSNLNYIIQKDSNSNYLTYNLVGYDIPELFINNISDFTDISKISNFEIMNDLLLIFQNDENNPIIAINFKLDKTQIENVSSKTDNYFIQYLSYNKLGSNNQSCNIKLSSQVEL